MASTVQGTPDGLGDSIQGEVENTTNLTDIVNPKNIVTNKLATNKHVSHQCEICKKVYRSASYLNIHTFTHTGQKPYTCFYCKKSFANPNNLRAHEQRHRGANVYQCRFCEKSLSSSHGRRMHENIHMGVKSENCEICNKAFSSPYYLKCHVQRVHEKVEKSFRCTVCDRTFACSSNLAAHRLTHSDEKQYSCGKCNKQFKQQFNLRIHNSYVHADTKLHPCELCSKSFVRFDRLKNHMWRKHDIDLKDATLKKWYDRDTFVSEIQLCKISESKCENILILIRLMMDCIECNTGDSLSQLLHDKVLGTITYLKVKWKSQLFFLYTVIAFSFWTLKVWITWNYGHLKVDLYQLWLYHLYHSKLENIFQETLIEGRGQWKHFIWTATWQNQQTECASSEDSDQHVHLPSLISLRCPHEESLGPELPIERERRLWSDWADVQADLSLHWAHTQFVGFVMSWLILSMWHMH